MFVSLTSDTMYVQDAVVFNSQCVIGGVFGSIEGKATAYLARYAPPGPPGDLDCDADVDLDDLLLILSGYGCTDAPCSGDTDNDGDTDLDDLLNVLADYSA